MLPFLKIPIILAGEGKVDENGAGEEDRLVLARIQPTHISAYHPGFYWGSFIYLNNGEVLCSKMDCEELEGKIQEYWKQVASFNKVKSTILS
jgi:hypothetical protein